MYHLRSLVSYSTFLVVGMIVAGFGSVVFAWTGPTQSPPPNVPDGNVSAPVNVGTTNQVKNGGLSVNTITVFGNSALTGNTLFSTGSKYLNFGVDLTNSTTITNTSGANGYGIRDNAGVLEGKSSGGSWARIATTSANGGGTITAGTLNYLSKYASAATLTESIIYDNGTNVGIGTALPTQRLDVQGGAIRQNINTTYDVWYQGGASTAGGDARNLAILGTDEDSGDMLYVNYAGEYGAGTTLGGNVYAAGYFHTSDARMKHDIRAMNGLDIISLLRGVRFKWNKDNSASVGVIAQEVEAVLPEAVRTDGEGMKSVDYAQLIAPLIEAIKEQQVQIDSLKYEIEVLKASN